VKWEEFLDAMGEFFYKPVCQQPYSRDSDAKTKRIFLVHPKWHVASLWAQEARRKAALLHRKGHLQ
jgi:hypothetical protein